MKMTSTALDALVDASDIFEFRKEVWEVAQGSFQKIRPARGIEVMLGLMVWLLPSLRG